MTDFGLVRRWIDATNNRWPETVGTSTRFANFAAAATSNAIGDQRLTDHQRRHLCGLSYDRAELLWHIVGGCIRVGMDRPPTAATHKAIVEHGDRLVARLLSQNKASAGDVDELRDYGLQLVADVVYLAPMPSRVRRHITEIVGALARSTVAAMPLATNELQELAA